MSVTDVEFLDLDAQESETIKRLQNASATRWVWQPFKDISLINPTGMAVINSLTTRGGSNFDWKAAGKEQPTPITTIRRCIPYPITNCEYEISIHEAVRYGPNAEFIPGNDLPDNFGGSSNPNDPRIRHATESKYAYSSARELSDAYAAEYGLVVLEPLTGIDDAALVKQIFNLVQPMTYHLANLQTELVEAKFRIEESDASPKLKTMAEGCRKLMLIGTERALATANAHFADFSRQIQLASAGQKGNRSAPGAYDMFIAEQLEVEVPRVVQIAKKNDSAEALLTRLAERELEPPAPQRNDEVTTLLLEELRAEREERQHERAERERLTAQVQELLAAKAQPAPQPAGQNNQNKNRG